MRVVRIRGIRSSPSPGPWPKNEEADDERTVSFEHVVRQDLPTPVVERPQAARQAFDRSGEPFRYDLRTGFRRRVAICGKRARLDEHRVLFHDIQKLEAISQVDVCGSSRLGITIHNRIVPIENIADSDLQLCPAMHGCSPANTKCGIRADFQITACVVLSPSVGFISEIRHCRESLQEAIRCR